MLRRIFAHPGLYFLSTATALGLGLACATPKETGIPGQNNDDDDDIGADDEGSKTTSAGDDDDDDDNDADTSTSLPPGDDDDDDNDVDTNQSSSDHPGETHDIPTDQKFDVIEIPDLPQEEDRCTKIDFVFVVDNSRSMQDEQIHLVESFPGFIDGITESAQLEDFRILVVDSDSNSGMQSSCTDGVCTCTSMGPGGGDNKEACCVDRCFYPDNTMCADKACTEFPEDRACEDRLGTGLTTDLNNMSCNVAGGHNYLLPDQPDLSDTFACLATVGTQGNSGELMIDATLRALAPDMLEAGGCNEGFLREDAILVITLITDEEEKDSSMDQGSMGNPAEWKEKVLAIKDNNETAVVVAGFVGDTATPGAICQPSMGGGTDGAQESPRLREFVSSFGDRSLLASVCADDYAPAFKEFVDKISVACDDWIPK